VARKEVPGHQPDDVTVPADHDLGFERKPAPELGAKLRPGDPLPDDEGARRADIDRIEVPELRSEHRGAESSVTADVDASQKNDNRHDYPLVKSRR
jgi:hypothetical protein